jgi:hypothetical protein
MPIMESTRRRLVLKSGSTTLTLSRDDDKAVMQQKILFWNRKPAETALSNISEIKVDAAVDRASGVEVYSTMLVMATGAAWALPATDRKDAQSCADALRTFLAAA